MIRYYITDRRALGGEAGLLQNVERLGSSVDFVQVRERDLSARELERLVQRIVGIASPGVRVLVNDRADVAVAAGAHGVHLRGNAIAASAMRRAIPEHFQISVACHTVDEVVRAADEGADLAVLAPIFQTPGKGPALGLKILRDAVLRAPIPVVALGGVSAARVDAIREAGASGFAGIRLFQDRTDGQRGGT